jgi:hypothetical protein
MSTVYVGSARQDEHKTYNGGSAGDQTGHEVETQKWYSHGKGWVVLRANDPQKRQLIANAMAAACKNNYIGYDQSQRLSLYTELSKIGFSVSNLAALKKKVECDCSALVRVCILCAGLKDPGNFRTASQPNMLMATGEYTKYTSAAYAAACDYLCAGDILVTPTSGHTVVVLTNGDKAGQDPEKPVVKTKKLIAPATMLSMPPAADIHVVETYEKGEEVTVYGQSPTNSEWVAVKINGKKGYVPIKNIT